MVHPGRVSLRCDEDGLYAVSNQGVAWKIDQASARLRAMFGQFNAYFQG
jgi:hypothetical protein